MGQPLRIDATTHRTMSERSYHGATSRSPPKRREVGDDTHYDISAKLALHLGQGAVMVKETPVKTVDFVVNKVKFNNLF